MLAIGFVFVNSLDRLIYAHTCMVSIKPVYLHRTLMLFLLVVTRASRFATTRLTTAALVEIAVFGGCWHYRTFYGSCMPPRPTPR